MQPDPLANLFDDLEPEPNAVANRPTGVGNDPYELAARYNVPPAMIRSILTEANGPLDRVLELQNEAFNGLGRFEALPEDSRSGAVQLIGDLLRERGQGIRNERQQAQLPAPAQPALPMAQRDPVPRNLQTMAIGNLINDMSPEWNRRAQELADTYFNHNIIDGPNISIGSLTGMLRDYRIGPHAEAPAEVRELAARRLEQLHAQAEGNAESIAEALNEAFYMDMAPQEAIDQISRDISALEQNGENFWEDLVGPMAEDMPWNANLQHHLIGYLEALMQQYGDMREADGFAKGGAVKKKRKAKSGGMPLVLTRKSPELTEMAYQYGGLV